MMDGMPDGQDPMVEARSTLFDWLGSAPHGGAYPADLDPEQWRWIAQTAREHRLLPLLHTVLRDGAPGNVPPEFTALCERAFRRQSCRWLAWQGAMVAIGGALCEQGIDHVFLKGAPLGLGAYREGGQRPLRDLDVLVPPDDAEKAQSVVMDLGYHGLPGGSTKSRATAYQLPALQHPKTGLVVEVHRALINAERYDFGALSDMLLATAQAHEVGGKTVRCAAPIALYCHLLLHAGIKSRFDCGPLVLADLAFLHARWPELRDDFREAARSFGLARTDALFSQLLIRHGGLPADAGQSRATVVSALVDHASALLVLPPDTIRARKFARDLHEEMPLGRKLLGFAGGALRPNRAKIAASARIAVDSRLIWLHYPRWLLNRGRLILAGGARAGLRTGVDRDRDLHEWLVGDAHAGVDRGPE